MRNWVAWHRGYDEPDRHLARRLAVVRGYLGRALEDAASPHPQVVSLCAGDGRDVIGVLADRAGGAAVPAVLVELDESLVARAAASAHAAGLDGVEVRCADASDLAAIADALPADVLLLCGIFGNVELDDALACIGSVPSLLSPGGYVLWTRGGGEPDLRPTIRAAFVDAGLDEVAYEGAPELYGVGLNRLPPDADRPTARRRHPLFTFIR